jgi:Asp-tRNA(Asn)/Glu-tRNA(Gln) amidotransferase C subunit
MKKLFTSIFALIISISNLSAYSSDEEEIKELKSQVVKILDRLDVLEKRVAKKTDIKTKPITQNTKSKKSVLEMKNRDTVLSVGGRIQLDTMYSWPQSSHSAKTIPVNNPSGEDGHILFDAKNSRLWVKTRTPSKYGMVRTLIETDFYGSGGNEISTNSSGIRLRHAYVNVGNWTVGQTNSTFNTFIPLDILYTAINDVLIRQPLIRYSQENQLYGWDISFEQPESYLLDADANLITPKDDILPDIATRFRYYPSWGEVGLSLIARYINQDDAIANTSDSALGWGSNFSIKLNTWNYDDIRLGAFYGKGLGRYLAYGAYADGSVDENGDIKLQNSYGYNIGYRHWWNSNLRSTISFSYAGTKNNTSILKTTANLANINKEAYSSQINLLWMPIKSSLIGLEYVKAKRKVQSGDDGDMDAGMLRMRYNF